VDVTLFNKASHKATFQTIKYANITSLPCSILVMRSTCVSMGRCLPLQWTFEHIKLSCDLHFFHELWPYVFIVWHIMFIFPKCYSSHIPYMQNISWHQIKNHSMGASNITMIVPLSMHFGFFPNSSTMMSNLNLNLLFFTCSAKIVKSSHIKIS